MGTRLAGLAFAAVLSFAFGSRASATLVEIDLSNVGDGLITRDTATGLDWLDLDQTVNLSVNDILADVGGWASLGFEHATRAQTCSLLANNLVAPSPCPHTTAALTTTSAVAAFQALFSITEVSVNINTDGWTLDGLNASRGTVQIVGSDGVISVDIVTVSPSARADFIGNWLIRPAPAAEVPSLSPVGFGLLIAFLLGAGRLRHRRTLRIGSTSCVRA